MNIAAKISPSSGYINFIMRSILLIFIALNYICLLNAQASEDTILVSAGWNMIGSLYSEAAIDIIRSEPPGIIISQFYGYNPALGYELMDTLKKGSGYWVKVDEEGLIIISSRDSNTGMPCPGIPTVDYGDRRYSTVMIGSQCWLRENLNVGTMIQAVDSAEESGIIEKYCYNDDSVHCNTMGGLYQWTEAMQYAIAEGARGICPPGWHIPTSAEFQTLSAAVDSDGNALKAIGQGTGEGTGTNTSGFSVLLAGLRPNLAVFVLAGQWTFLWSSTGSLGNPNCLRFESSNSDMYLGVSPNFYGLSIRCLKN